LRCRQSHRYFAGLGFIAGLGPKKTGFGFDYPDLTGVRVRAWGPVKERRETNFPRGEKTPTRCVRPPRCRRCGCFRARSPPAHAGPRPLLPRGSPPPFMGPAGPAPAFPLCLFPVRCGSGGLFGAPRPPLEGPWQLAGAGGLTPVGLPLAPRCVPAERWGFDVGPPPLAPAPAGLFARPNPSPGGFFPRRPVAPPLRRGPCLEISAPAELRGPARPRVPTPRPRPPYKTGQIPPPRRTSRTSAFSLTTPPLGYAEGWFPAPPLA